MDFCLDPADGRKSASDGEAALLNVGDSIAVQVRGRTGVVARKIGMFQKIVRDLSNGAGRLKAPRSDGGKSGGKSGRQGDWDGLKDVGDSVTVQVGRSRGVVAGKIGMFVEVVGDSLALLAADDGGQDVTLSEDVAGGGDWSGDGVDHAGGLCDTHGTSVSNRGDLLNVGGTVTIQIGRAAQVIGDQVGVLVDSGHHERSGAADEDLRIGARRQQSQNDLNK